MFVDIKFYVILIAIPIDSHYKDLEKRKYTVTEINMGQGNTSIMLKDFTVPFNSVHFAFFMDGREVDIYSSPMFNHYMRISDKAINGLIKYVD